MFPEDLNGADIIFFVSLLFVGFLFVGDLEVSLRMVTGFSVGFQIVQKVLQVKPNDAVAVDLLNVNPLVVHEVATPCLFIRADDENEGIEGDALYFKQFGEAAILDDVDH
jgi:hypothetical protein